MPAGVPPPYRPAPGGRLQVPQWGKQRVLMKGTNMPMSLLGWLEDATRVFWKALCPGTGLPGLCHGWPTFLYQPGSPPQHPTPSMPYILPLMCPEMMPMNLLMLLLAFQQLNGVFWTL